MACPYFYPTRPAAEAVQRRAPLGHIYEGECHAAGAPRPAASDVVYDVCNFGYGKGRCQHLPEKPTADAVRFFWRNGKPEFVHEKDWAPVAAPPGIPPLQRQLTVFALSGNVR